MAHVTQTVTLDPEEIRKKSQIYQLKHDDKLLDYHRAINEASFEIVMKNPSLLCSKSELQNQARLKVHEEGFSYKKNTSRSKQFGVPQTKNQRDKLDLRQKRMEQLQEDLHEVDMQLSYAVKQRERCANVKEFSKALDVSKELDELRKKKRKYKEELTLLQKKEASAKRVKKFRDSQKKTPDKQDAQQSSIIRHFTRTKSAVVVEESTNGMEVIEPGIAVTEVKEPAQTAATEKATIQDQEMTNVAPHVSCGSNDINKPEDIEGTEKKSSEDF